jgi:hypothetical protein
MAGGPKDEKAETPAADDLEAVAVVGTGEGGAPAPSGDSPKPHGDKMEHALRGAAPRAEGNNGAAPSPPSGDSPKPHGDKMEHAVREAAGKPPKGGG